MFYVSLQGDHLIVRKLKKKFCLNCFVFVPIWFVLLFKKVLQLVSLFLLSRSIQSLLIFVFCRSVSIWFYLSSLILLPFVFDIVLIFIVSLQADHLIVTKQLRKRFFFLNYFLLVAICLYYYLRNLNSSFPYSFCRFAFNWSFVLMKFERLIMKNLLIWIDFPLMSWCFLYRSRLIIWLSQNNW